MKKIEIQLLKLSINDIIDQIQNNVHDDLETFRETLLKKIEKEERENNE